MYFFHFFSLFSLVDADEDILSFDPLAPPKKQVDPLTAAALEREKQNKDTIDSGAGGGTTIDDLSDFDPLAQPGNDNTTTAVKQQDKMSADLLRRSREVVSTRALAGKSWLERTFSQGLQLNQQQNEVFYFISLFPLF